MINLRIFIIQGTLQNRCHLFAKNPFQSKLEFSDAPQRAKIFLWRSSSEAPPQTPEKLEIWKAYDNSNHLNLKTPEQLEFWKAKDNPNHLNLKTSQEKK